MHATRLVQSELTHLRGDRTRPPFFHSYFASLVLVSGDFLQITKARQADIRITVTP